MEWCLVLLNDSPFHGSFSALLSAEPISKGHSAFHIKTIASDTSVLRLVEEGWSGPVSQDTNVLTSRSAQIHPPVTLCLYFQKLEVTGVSPGPQETSALPDRKKECPLTGDNILVTEEPSRQIKPSTKKSFLYSLLNYVITLRQLGLK